MNMAYRIGDIVEGKVTGIQAYGAFVSLDEKTSGLIHISEISDGYVKDIGHFVKVGDLVKVKIIDFDEEANQARLSLKALRHARPRVNRKAVIQKVSLPEGIIGFSSLSSHLNEWIEEAKKEKDNEI